MKSNKLFIYLTAIIIITVTACRKDRVPQDDYQNMDSFYSDHEEEEQEYTIDTNGTCPLVCKKGTKICVNAEMFELNGGGQVTYPFQLKVIELYSIKDMILRRIPSVASGNPLETSAEIRVRAFKNGNEIFLKPGKKYFLETAALPSINSAMQSFYGYSSGNSANNWTNTIANFIPGFVDTLSNISPTSNSYVTTPATIGWFSPALLYQSASTTSITCSVTGTNTQNLQVYVSFKGFKGVMQIQNLSGTNFPVGENVTLIVFGKKQNNQYVLDQQNFTIAANQQIIFNLQDVSENDILNALSAL